MITADPRDEALHTLARRLLVTGDRIGWEYVEPDPVAKSLAIQPRWLEPLPPDVRGLEMRARTATRRLRWTVPLGGLLALLGLAQVSTTGGFVALLIGIAVLAAAVVSVLVARGRITDVRRAAAMDRAERWAAFQQTHAHYEADVAAHDDAEQHRFDVSLRWFPLGVRPGDRLDVFGGGGEARSALLATLGCSILASRRMVVLDLTEESIASPLAVLAAAGGVPVTTVDLPAGIGCVDLLADLDASEAAELLAESVHPRRHGEGHDDHGEQARDLGADLIGSVLDRLDAKPSMARLVGGLRALSNTYDAGSDDSLTETEFVRLTAAAHDVVGGERSRDELRLLVSRLQLLAVPGGAAGVAFEPMSGSGLTVVTTESAGNQRRKELLDRILGGLTLRAVRRARGGRTESTVVVVGAGRLGTADLESLARAATVSPVRLIYVFDHLRDATLPLLGGPNSTAVIMRLGNKDEAAAAADFIGREHRFVLGQVSRQKGTTSTVGGGSTRTSGTSSTYTRGSQHGGSRQGLHGGSNWGTSESVANGVSHSTATNETWSIADSYTEGQVDTRVYEYVIEPSAVQSLPPTSFILVDTAAENRVVMGNCDPRVTELDLVAGTPR